MQSHVDANIQADSPMLSGTPKFVRPQGSASMSTAPKSLGGSSRTVNGGALSDTSGDYEDVYKEKVLHLQILVKDLSQQLQSERIRKEGIGTISRCLQEEREANAQLQVKVRHLEAGIVNLQNRCAKHGLSTSLEIEQGEVFPPGLSQHVFDGLVKENARLKQQLKYLSVDPSRMEESLVQIKELQQRAQEQEQEKLRLAQEVESLSLAMGSSPNEKTQEIERLRKRIEDLEQNKQKQDILCQSLSEQAGILQQRLRQTAEMCQLYAIRLQESEAQLSTLRSPSRGADSEKHQQEAAASLEKMSLGEEGKTMEEPTSRLREENIALRTQLNNLDTRLKQVIEINKDWQKHSTERESEFAAIKEKLHETENRLSMAPTSQISETQQEQIDKLILQYKHQRELVEKEKSEIEDENRRLRVELDRERRTTCELQNKVMTLEVQLQTRSASAGGRKEDTERIQMLEAQIQLCTEDFESERRDRERAQGKLVDLESKLVAKDEEIDLIKQQLQRFQRDAMFRLQQRRAGNLNVYQCDDTPAPQPIQPSLIGRGVFQTDTAEDEDEDVEGEDTIDFPLPRKPRQPSPPHQALRTSPPLQPSRSSPPLRSRGPPSPTHKQQGVPLTVTQGSNLRVNSLQCPKCKKDFPVERHGDLIDHMDSCCH